MVKTPWGIYKKIKEDVSPAPLPPAPMKREEPVIPKPSQPTPPRYTATGEGPRIDTRTPEEKFEEFVEQRPVVEQQMRMVDKPPQIQPGERITDYRTRALEHYKTKYRETGYIPWRVRQQIKQQVPSEIYKYRLYPEYTRAVYEQSIGVDTSAKRILEKKYKSEFEKRQTISWAKKNLVFIDPDTNEEVTFTELKKKEPALYLKKTSKGFIVEYDPVRWQQEENKKHEGDLGYYILKGISSIFSTERATIAAEQLFGTGEPTVQEGMVQYYGKRKERYLAESQYRYSQLAAKGDTLGIVLRGVSSPAASIPIAYGIGIGFGVFSQTSLGMTSLATVKGIAVTPTTIVGIGAGSYFAGSVGLSLYDVYSKEGVEGLRKSIRDMGVVAPLQVMGFKAGYQAGVVYSPKVKAIGRGVIETYYTKVAPRISPKTFLDKKIWMFKTKSPSYGFMFKEKAGIVIRRAFPKYDVVKSRIRSNIVLKSMREYKIKWGYEPYEIRDIYQPAQPFREITQNMIRLFPRNLKPKISTTPSKWFLSPREPYWIKITGRGKPLIPKKLTDVIKSIDIKPTKTGLITKSVSKTVKVHTGMPQLAEILPSRTVFRFPSSFALAYGGVSLSFLSFLEEGIDYRSNYWSDKFSKIKKDTNQSLSNIPVITPGIGMVSAQQIGTVNLYQPIQIPSIESDIAKLTRQRNIQETEKVIETELAQQPLFRPISALASAQIMNLSLVQITTQIPKTRYIHESYPYETTVGKPKKFPKIPGIEKGFEEIFTGEKDEQVFNVMVKDRYIVKGKKKYVEKFIRVNKNPLARRDALSLGGTVVDNSAARSFKLVPASGRRGKPSISTSFWSMLGYKFRQSRKNDIFVEKTGYAIDTPGEIAEISARGWVAQQRRMTLKSMKIINEKDLRNIVKGGKLF